MIAADLQAKLPQELLHEASQTFASKHRSHSMTNRLAPSVLRMRKRSSSSVLCAPIFAHGGPAARGLHSALSARELCRSRKCSVSSRRCEDCQLRFILSIRKPHVDVDMRDVS